MTGKIPRGQATPSAVALIGCGRIGFLLEGDPLRYKPCTHWGGASAAGLAITHACDIDAARLARFGTAAGIPDDRLSTDYRHLLARARPRIAVIATWTDSHAAIAIEAARRGARVIVLEKPMASSLSQCRRIIEECRRRDTAVIINHERRYDGRYRKVKELIARGTIGEVKTVHASVLTGGYAGPSDAAEGGGPLLHDGTHMVDMARYLFGEITWVRGRFEREKRKRGFEDRACAWIRTAGGIDIFLEAGGSRGYFLFELDISGTRGRIVIGNGYERIYRSRASRLYTGFRDLEERSFPAWRRNNCFRDLYREARALAGGGPPPVSGAEDGYRALEVIHAVYLSASRGGETLGIPVSPGSMDLKKIFGLT
ncbi:MAG: Gfo/Idh/MocA family oxidoreductase [Spirochaetes bacterium]|nr:Gfo/Idh/MocA family oxidoreductase [Spirochaetota bacterium]